MRRIAGLARPDPEVMGPLNSPVVQMSRDDLRSSSRPPTTSIAISSASSTRSAASKWILHGRYRQRAPPGHVQRGDRREGVVGQRRHQRGARRAARSFFRAGRGGEGGGQPLARNFPAVLNYKAQGWRHEGTQRAQRRSVSGGVGSININSGCARRMAGSSQEGDLMAEDSTRARAMLADAIGAEPALVPQDARIGVFERWDSLAHLRLILAVEQYSGGSSIRTRRSRSNASTTSHVCSTAGLLAEPGRRPPAHGDCRRRSLRRYHPDMSQPLSLSNGQARHTSGRPRFAPSARSSPPPSCCRRTGRAPIVLRWSRDCLRRHSSILPSIGTESPSMSRRRARSTGSGRRSWCCAVPRPWRTAADCSARQRRRSTDGSRTARRPDRPACR